MCLCCNVSLCVTRVNSFGFDARCGYVFFSPLVLRDFRICCGVHSPSCPVNATGQWHWLTGVLRVPTLALCALIVHRQGTKHCVKFSPVINSCYFVDFTIVATTCSAWCLTYFFTYSIEHSPS
jgi:hypothetical protein